jgi:acyl-CoA thioesterase-1
VDVPGLPRVLLIGDSISIGYTVRVREALRGKANVHRVPDNCGATKKGVEQIDNWLGNGKWDVIHFNFGLHDVRRLDGDVVYVPASLYEENLRRLAKRMKRTGAKLVWATTTPAPPEPKPGQFRRVPRDVRTYNEIAGRIMTENGIASNDLYSAVAGQTAELQPKGDVHFNSKGYDVLAGHVAKQIEALLPKTQ